MIYIKPQACSSGICSQHTLFGLTLTENHVCAITRVGKWRGRRRKGALCPIDWCRAQGPWHTARQQMASQTAVTLEAKWLAHMKGKHVSDIWQGYAWASLASAKQGNKAKGPSLSFILSYS